MLVVGQRYRVKCPVFGRASVVVREVLPGGWVDVEVVHGTLVGRVRMSVWGRGAMKTLLVSACEWTVVQPSRKKPGGVQ
jgi:hypothetical protein